MNPARKLLRGWRLTRQAPSSLDSQRGLRWSPSAVCEYRSLLVAVTALLATCSPDCPRRRTLAARPTTPDASGCGLSPPHTGDFYMQTTDGNGTPRDYEVIVPSTASSNTPLALTFVYHGAGNTESGAKAFGLQRAPGAASASIFVFPQGIPYRSYGVGWDDSCSGYDMVFFDNMLNSLEATYCIDRKAVFAAGFSWGGDQVTSLSCCRGDRLRAIAAASCTDDFSNPADASTYVNRPCPSSGHTGIRFTFDPAGDVGYSAQYFATTIALYRSFNGCSSSTTPTTVNPCASFNGCTTPLVACPYPGLGHALPPNWAADTWSFFSTFR